MATPAVSRHVGVVDYDLPSPRRIASAYKAYAGMDTDVLMPVPALYFPSDHDVPDLVHFTSALRDVITSMRVACDDTHPVVWRMGWGEMSETSSLFQPYVPFAPLPRRRR